MLTSSSIKKAQVDPTLYFEAVDYINRVRNERKFTEMSLQLFSLLYPKSCYDALVAQGFFNVNNN